MKVDIKGASEIPNPQRIEDIERRLATKASGVYENPALSIVLLDNGEYQVIRNLRLVKTSYLDDDRPVTAFDLTYKIERRNLSKSDWRAAYTELTAPVVAAPKPAVDTAAIRQVARWQKDRGHSANV